MYFFGRNLEINYLMDDLHKILQFMPLRAK